MVLKQWQAGSKVEGEEALLHYSCRFLLQRAEQAFVEIFDNLPNRALGKTLNAVVMPTGRRWNKPHDDLARDIAKRVSTHSALRTKLLENTWDADDGEQRNPLARYNALLVDYDRAEAIYRTVNKAYAKGELPQTALHPEARVEAGLEKGLINEEDADFMRIFEAEVLEMLTVDDFAYDAFAKNKSTLIDHNGKPVPAPKQAEENIK